MTGWISDIFRLGWGALYWNTRKTWHRLGDRRGPCPCQVASDSGLAHRTGCEAVTPFRSPARFRAVCPLLARRADGAWVCSVDTERIRPFWGRALLVFAVGGLGSYAVATLVVFLGLHALGFHPAYHQVAWPGAWPELRAVQARRHLEKSQEARAAGRPAEAILALASAYELNPSDYASGLLLAQLWQGAQPVQSDTLFARLYREHPEQREQTARTWYRALLARGDFEAVLALSRDRLLTSGGDPSPAWTQAFLFACRRAGKTTTLAELVDNPALPASPRALVAIENTLARRDAPERVRVLADAIPGLRDAFSANYLLRRLLEEGRPDLVLSFLAENRPPLGNREKILLRLDALAALGRAGERGALIRQLLSQPSGPANWELISAHLIAHPDREFFQLVAEKHRRDPLPAQESAYPALLAWFAACGANTDAESLAFASSLLEQAAARDSLALALARARQLFLAPPGTFRLENILPLLQPIPLETAYALYARYAPAP